MPGYVSVLKCMRDNCVGKVLRRVKRMSKVVLPDYQSTQKKKPPLIEGLPESEGPARSEIFIFPLDWSTVKI